jgi:hypothetical protein
MDISTESWASDILNQSQVMSEPSPLRAGVICRTIFSTPRRAVQNADGLNDTFSTVHLSPIISARAVPDFFTASVRVPPPPVGAPAPAGAPAPVGAPAPPVVAPAPRVVAPAPRVVAPALPAVAPALPAHAAAIPAAAGGDAAQRRRRREDEAVPPPPVEPRNPDAVLDMTREKSRLDRLVSAENIRLMRISHRATVQAAHQRALTAQEERLYWAAKREELVADRLAKGQNVGEQIVIPATADCPLLSGDLANQIDLVQGDRKVIILTVMQFSYLFIYF